MKETKTYTARDIERYHSGRLSAAESHALEKAALDDPFLADALEGYVFTKNIAPDLQALKQKLTKRIEEKDKKIFSLGTTWMKIAALFVLMAGGGWLVFQTLFTQKKELAVNVEKPAAPLQTPSYKSTDTATQNNYAENNTYLIPNKGEDKAASSVKPLQVPSFRTPPVTPKEVARDIASTTGYEKKIMSSPHSEGLKADSLLLTMDRELSKPSGRGLVGPDTVKNVDVVMQQSVMDEKDIVVLNKNRAKTAPKRSNLVIDTLEPAQGWTNFDDYIISHMRSPEQLQMKTVSGEVELSFEVSKEGEPVNITITKSLCEKCDKEAIRLLKEGPKWSTKKNKGKVKIKF